MNKTLIALIVVLVAGLAGASVWALMTRNTLASTQQELADARSQIAAMTSELDQTKGKLAVTEVSLSTTEAELNKTNAEFKETQLALASTSQKLDSTSSELSDTKVELVLTETKLSDTQTELTTTINELTSAKAESTNAKSQLATAQTELTSATSELTSTKSELTTTKNELTATKSELSTTKTRMVTIEDTLKGLGMTISASSTCTDASLIDNPQAKNPTWQELRTFLLQDTTEQHEYIANVYDCSEYSRDVHNNAEAAGIRTAVVHTWFWETTTGHALNAFLTSDYGLVYVDCTEAPDRIAYVEKGEGLKEIEPTYITQWNIRDYLWWGRVGWAVGYYYYIPGGMVTSIEIFW